MVRMRWSSRRSGVRVPFKRATLWIKVFTATGGTPSPGIRRVDPCMPYGWCEASPAACVFARTSFANSLRARTRPSLGLRMMSPW
jgi:hypothetical protein